MVAKVEMMVRLNKLYHHFVHVVTSKNIGKLIRICDIKRRSPIDDYTVASSGGKAGNIH
jgi:hypothetical protein